MKLILLTNKGSDCDTHGVSDTPSWRIWINKSCTMLTKNGFTPYLIEYKGNVFLARRRLKKDDDWLINVVRSLEHSWVVDSADCEMLVTEEFFGGGK